MQYCSKFQAKWPLFLKFGIILYKYVHLGMTGFYSTQKVTAGQIKVS